VSEEKEPRPEKKTLGERAKELVQDVLEALEDLVPQPDLVPVPTNGGRRRRR